MIRKYSVRKYSVLWALRKLHPDQKWRAVRSGFGSWEYETESGWMAGWRSCLAPTHDGDDTTCVSRFFIYKPNLPTEEVFFAGGNQVFSL